MKVLTKIIVPINEINHTIDFGIPESEEERQEMFRLRYKIYVEKKKYIPAELCENGVDIDDYDRAGVCTYFLARINDKIVGTLRTIKMDPLPIFKSYFKFDENERMRSVLSESKIEIGRLISTGSFDEKFLPRHLIPLGLFRAVVQFSAENSIVGGYGAIKLYIYKKLQLIKFPIHLIDKYTVIYDMNCQDPLKNFFNNPNDPVIPVFFLRDEIDIYLKKLFHKSYAFSMVGENQYFFKGRTRLTIAHIAQNFGL